MTLFFAGRALSWAYARAPFGGRKALDNPRRTRSTHWDGRRRRATHFGGRRPGGSPKEAPGARSPAIPGY